MRTVEDIEIAIKNNRGETVIDFYRRVVLCLQFLKQICRSLTVYFLALQGLEQRIDFQYGIQLIGIFLGAENTREASTD